MKKSLILSLVLLAAGISAADVVVKGPDGRLEFRLRTEDGVPQWSATYDGRFVTEWSPLGLVTEYGDFTRGVLQGEEKKGRFRDSYEMQKCKRAKVSVDMNSAVVPLLSNGERLGFEVRVGRNDLAFRYLVDKATTVYREATGFAFSPSAKMFATQQSKPMTGFAATKPSYEETYVYDADLCTKSDSGEGWTFPMLVRIPGMGGAKDLWTLVSETGTDGNYCGCRLSDWAGGCFRVAFPMAGEARGKGAVEPKCAARSATPWRTLTVGDSLAPIVETTISYDVVKPVVPAPREPYEFGRGSWSWIVWDDASMNVSDQRKFINLAAEMGWEHILVDAFWDRIPAAEFDALLAYAKEKNVAVYLWYNSNGDWNDAPQTPKDRLVTRESTEREMAWLESKGVRGIKVDFWGGDKQFVIAKYCELFEIANRHHIQVFVHGCTLPRGWERMYPNFVGAEALLASENAKFSDWGMRSTPQWAATHPFCRNAVAVAEYGPVFLNRFLRADNKTGVKRTTTDSFELATAIIYQNPVQNFALTPNNLTDAPSASIEFMKKVPTVWDETRYVAGYPGKYAIIARRHGCIWYVAGVAAEDVETEMDLSFAGGRREKVRIARADGFVRQMQVDSACESSDVVVERTAAGFVVCRGEQRRTLEFYGPNTMRVKTDLGRDHWKHPSLAIVARPNAVDAKLRETQDAFIVEGAAFTVSIDRKTGALTFSDAGKVLLREPYDPCTLKEVNIDGEPTYEVTQRWKLDANEGLYGLGQAVSGKFNLRGQKIKIVQTNIPAFSPVWSSSKGYMILWDVYSQSIFHDKPDGLELWGESAPGGSDWYFMYGSDPDRRFAEYRKLTGAAPMFPKAAFGYFQSKERYKTAQELIDVVSRFRALGYPIDWIVQDWQYWDARHERWNAMQWDKTRFPDPKGLCDTLHNDLHVKLITSIWPDVGDDTDVARELDAHKLRYAPGHWISKGRSHVYDAYSKLGREIYFKHLKKGLFDVGVDAMWMDGSELETGDACHNADRMVEQIKACGGNEMGDFTRYLNTYGLVTTMGNYEGRRATSDRRTFTLTRTAWAGLQRYAAIPWSGDTGASWGRLKDEIAGGLGASMSGLPYWTQDTGGFFCGHYGDAMNNPEYLELLARWNQFAIFNPVYRWHVSSPVAKEPFRAKEKHPEYYESFLSAARLRYRLLPYIYSLARDVHETGRPFVRPAWIDFPETPGAADDQTSVVFGPSLYTSVITRPIYTGSAAGAGSPVPAGMLATPDGKAGVKVEYFKGQDLKAKVSETVVPQINDTWPGPPLVEWPAGLSGGDDFSCRYTGRLTLSEPGVYELGIEGDDGFALWLDGEEKFRDWAKRAVRGKSTRVSVPEGGKTFDFRIDYFNDRYARSVKFWLRTPEEVTKLERESRKVEVVLPVGADWFDFRTGERFAGGAKLSREYPIDSFPLFVKAGSILPLGPDVQYATEKTDKPIELRVYPGADASFTLYFDDDETYAYEKGAFEKIPLSWSDAEKTLTIGAREGSFPGMPKTREFRVVCGGAARTVRYDGKAFVVDFGFHD